MKWLTMALTFLLSSVLAAQSITGQWTTVDESTGKPRAVVNLSVSGGVLQGRIIKVFPQPGDTGICSKCPGQFKDKPIKGMGFVWGLKQKSDNVWVDGHILDPKTGKVYRAKMTLKGNKLEVRGYLGISLLGRTQVWVR